MKWITFAALFAVYAMALPAEGGADGDSGAAVKCRGTPKSTGGWLHWGQWAHPGSDEGAGCGNDDGGTDTPPPTYEPCASSGIYSQAQCCSTDVLGVADLDCTNPTSEPTSADDFSAVCSQAGKQPKCCLLPLLGQGILCQNPPAAAAAQ